VKSAWARYRPRVLANFPCYRILLLSPALYRAYFLSALLKPVELPSSRVAGVLAQPAVVAVGLINLIIRWRVFRHQIVQRLLGNL
jgi:hypothetical protein